MERIIKPIFIGIAGGTGAGKSTVCSALLAKYPSDIVLIQLDDYFKPAADIPRLNDMENWDHPDSLYLEKLADDLKELSAGRSVVINTKNEILNPEYKHTEQRILAKFMPMPVMLVEGYLVLWDERVRKFFERSIFLDVAHDVRWERRVHFKIDGYENAVLVPMHEQFVEPTKRHASDIIDVSDLKKDEVFKKVEEIILPYFRT